jgi:hypothetical protein
MTPTGKKILWTGLILLTLVIERMKYYPEWIEAYYSQKAYPPIGFFLRRLFGRVPFSVGDALVAALFFWLVFQITFWVKKTDFKNFHFRLFKQPLLGSLKFLLGAYILFNLFWGLNYYRLGSSYLLELTPDNYSTEEVDTLVSVIQGKLITLTEDSQRIEQARTKNRSILSDEALLAFKAASNQYPFIAFTQPSLKSNLIGKFQSYTGYAGYMFPFTGEAHVNFYAPSYSLPFSVCHEMAHQLGFGAESEANLIGFLAARSSANKSFEYSAYAGVHSYALRELFIRDSLKAKFYNETIPPLLKKDRSEMQKFLKEHKSFLQPGLDVAYNWYLLSQHQEQGILSYNYVVAWLIAYGKKYGWEKL